MAIYNQQRRTNTISHVSWNHLKHYNLFKIYASKFIFTRSEAKYVIYDMIHKQKVKKCSPHFYNQLILIVDCITDWMFIMTTFKLVVDIR